MFKHLHGKKLCVIALKKFYKHVVYDSITERFFVHQESWSRTLDQTFLAFFLSFNKTVYNTSISCCFVLLILVLYKDIKHMFRSLKLTINLFNF